MPSKKSHLIFIGSICTKVFLGFSKRIHFSVAEVKPKEKAYYKWLGEHNLHDTIEHYAQYHAITD